LVIERTMIFRTILGLSVALFAIPAVQAKKHIWPFVCVVHSADLIVVGSIVSVSPKDVTVLVEDRVYGTCEEEITVAKWKEWTCDQRFAPYKVGQRMLLLLEGGVEGYTTINASTGELEVKNDSVTVYREDQRFQLKQFTEVLADVTSCFTVVEPYGPAFGEKPSNMVLHRNCPAQGTHDPGPVIPARRWLYLETYKYLPEKER